MAAWAAWSCRFRNIKLFRPFWRSCSLKCWGGCRYLQGGSFLWHLPWKESISHYQAIDQDIHLLILINLFIASNSVRQYITMIILCEMSALVVIETYFEMCDVSNTKSSCTEGIYFWNRNTCNLQTVLFVFLSDLSKLASKTHAGDHKGNHQSTE